jgi:hypothetical protein
MLDRCAVFVLVLACVLIPRIRLYFASRADRRKLHTVIRSVPNQREMMYDHASLLLEISVLTRGLRFPFCYETCRPLESSTIPHMSVCRW